MGLFDGLFDNFGLGDILELGGTAAGLISAFSGGPEVPKAVKRSARTAEQITQALLHPTTDPMFLGLEHEQDQAIRGDYAQALNMLRIGNNRAVARTGGIGYLNPERRDETINDVIRTSEIDRKQRSREQARAYLAQALGANAGIATAYAPQMQQQQNDYTSLMSGFEATSALGTSINNRGMLNGSNTPAITVNYTPTGSNQVLPSRYTS